MEQDPKTIIVISALVVVLFAGGLTYIYRQSQNRQVAMGLVWQYVNTEDLEAKIILSSEIKQRIQKPPLVMTSRASFDSFEVLIQNAESCNEYAVAKSFAPRDAQLDYEELWRDCMDNPAVLTK